MDLNDVTVFELTAPWDRRVFVKKLSEVLNFWLKCICRLSLQRGIDPTAQHLRGLSSATTVISTRDLLFTRELLYRLS